ncbi:MAG: nuclear transport factor 2 family protein [Lacibacter sp.]|nr:nuclear transport factor 2 family protein [Lacibacter sp.]
MRTLKFITAFLIAAIVFGAAHAQKAKQKQQDKELFATIMKLDSTWFSSFNKDLVSFSSFLDSSLEFYHDGGGLSSYADNIAAFKRMKASTPDLTRELLIETMEVYPIPGYGAVQIAQHRFCHMENGKMNCGVFKFIHTWKKTETGWKVTRIISVDH